MIVTQREREAETQAEGEAETQAEGEAGSMHREPDVGCLLYTSDAADDRFLV